MTKIINLNKPIGISSNFTLIKFRKITGLKKSGYAGTLDPFASGVLLIGYNEGTKLLTNLTNAHKKYIFTLKFGILTDTFDLTGNILETQNKIIHISELNDVLKYFIGKIEQIPPIYSALKFNGKRLCDIARKNLNNIDLSKIVEEKKRIIEIYDIKILSQVQSNEFEIFVFCSKGTYIRSLAVDIAKKLNTIAHILKLKRIAVENYTIENSIQLEELNNFLSLSAK